MYNNKRLKKCDLEEDIDCYRNYGIIYLKISIKGGGKIDKRAYELNSHWKDYIENFNIRDHTIL